MHAQELKAILKKLKVTPSGLTEQMGVSRNTVTRWCKGSNPIPLWAKKFVDLLVEVQRLRGLDQWVKEALTKQTKKKPRF
jgi:DNA-binding transcriptional regulator YiaG